MVLSVPFVLGQVFQRDPKDKSDERDKQPFRFRSCACAICGKSARCSLIILHDLSPFVFKIGNDFGLRWYGLAYVLSFLLGGWLYRWLARRGFTDLPPEQVTDFITWAAVFGVMIGGRLGWVIFYGWHDVMQHPLTLFKVWEGGMASHGGILGLVLFTLYWSRKHHVSWTSIGDCLVVVAPIGLFLVRTGEFHQRRALRTARWRARREWLPCHGPCFSRRNGAATNPLWN